MSKRAAALVLLAAVALAPLGSAAAQDLSYRIVREWVVLQVERDGTVLLSYNLTVGVDSGAIRRFVRVGMPVGSFEVLEARELETGLEVDYDEVREGDYYAVELHPSSPIEAGESRTFTFTALVEDFVYADETNPGNVGVQFTPSWFEDAPVEDLRLLVVLPEGVEPSEVRNYPDYDNLMSVDGRVALYWERRDLYPGERFEVGVSFPSRYVEHYVEAPGSRGILYRIGQILGVLIIFAPFAFIAAYILYARTRKYLGEYESPWIGIEALGPQKRLNPPEAAYLMLLESGKREFSRVITVALIEALKLGVLEIEGLRPLRLRVREKEDRGPLKYYLRRLVRCVQEDGSLDEDCLAKLIKVVHRATYRKLSGFSREETVDFYRKKIAEGWRELQSAPPERKREVLDEWIEWLMIDENFFERLRKAMRSPEPAQVVLPSDWWMYRIWRWTWPGWDRRVVITTRPAPGAPGAEPAREPRTVTGIERRAEGPVVSLEKAADEVARGVESVFDSVADSAEGLADRVARLIAPERTRPRSRTRTAVSSCVCACVSCACACACVSCACACAGGGAG